MVLTVDIVVDILLVIGLEGSLHLLIDDVDRQLDFRSSQGRNDVSVYKIVVDTYIKSGHVWYSFKIKTLPYFNVRKHFLELVRFR